MMGTLVVKGLICASYDTLAEATFNSGFWFGWLHTYTAQKMKFSIKDFFSKCDLRI